MASTAVVVVVVVAAVIDPPTKAVFRWNYPTARGRPLDRRLRVEPGQDGGELLAGLSAQRGPFPDVAAFFYSRLGEDGLGSYASDAAARNFWAEYYTFALKDAASDVAGHVVGVACVSAVG